jgi:carbonic anhydrase
MRSLERLKLKNKTWAEEKRARNPTYFERLTQGQPPDILWIGCSDNRVPSELVVDAQPGEIFVHRNIANQVITTDFNSLSVLQYAVDVLKVEHVVVCGHYNCGGIKAALERRRADLMLVNKWLMHIKDVYRLHQRELETLESRDAQVDRLVELNVIEQVHNLSHTSIVQQSWLRHGRPSLHGWVYGLRDGIIKELIALEAGHPLPAIYQYADPA